MDSDRTILIITNHYPGKKSGGSIASLAFINSLGTLFNNCILIYPSNGKEDCSHFFKNIELVACSDKRPIWLKGVQVYFGILHRFAKTALHEIILRQPDIIVFDTSLVSSGILDDAEKHDIRIITIHHNVESEYSRNNPPSFLYRLPFTLFLRKAEKRALSGSYLNLVLTEDDLIGIINRYGKDRISRIRCCGVSEPGPESSNEVLSQKASEKSPANRFVITGSLRFRMSDRSIRNFLKEYWPLIKTYIPGAELIIAGSNPTTRLKRICRITTGVELVADPLNIDEIVASCDIYVCPVDSGSGFKFRIADGLRAGLPAVVHRKSSAGYEDLIEEGLILVYDNRDNFIDCIEKTRSILVNPEVVIKKYRERFSFETGVQRFREILEETCI